MALRVAKVIQKNSVSYAECGGKDALIPCGDDSLGIAGEYWAVPVKDHGVFRGYTYQRATAAPTYDSFPVTKVYDKTTGENFWVVATQAEVLTLCSVGTAPATVIPLVVPEIDLCVEAGATESVEFSLEALVSPNDAYKFSLAVDGVLLVDENDGVASAGYANAAAIAAYLVTNHAAVGTWTSPAAGRIKLVVSADKAVGLVVTPYNNP